jgi:hypothetical protein
MFCRTLQKRKKQKFWVKKSKKGKTPIETQAATQHVSYNTSKGKKLKLILIYVYRYKITCQAIRRKK